MSVRGHALRRRTRGGLALIAAALIAGCASADQRAADAAARYDALMVAGAAPAARLEINKAVAARDDVADYWMKLGRVELALNNFTGAYQAFQRALELDQGNTEALQSVTELAFAGNLLEEAERRADQMLSLAPTNLRAQVIKGSVLLKRRKFDEAARYAAGALKADPNSDMAILLQGKLIAANEGVVPAAAYLVKEQARLAKPSVLILTDLVGFQREANDLPGARATLARLAALQPENLDVQLDHARALFRAGDTARATAVTERLVRRNAEAPPVLERIVALWLESGPGAIGDGRIAALAEGAPRPVRLALARYALEDGRPAAAAGLTAPMLGDGRVDADTVQANGLHARAELALGRDAAAAARAARVLAFDESAPHALIVRAERAIEAGDADRAIGDARVLVRDDPTFPRARLLLARAYVAKGDRALADRTLREASRALPDNHAILDAYLTFLTGAGRPGAALRLAETFTRDNPDLAAGWQARAALCGRVGDAGCAGRSRVALAQLARGVSPLPPPEARRPVAAAGLPAREPGA